MLDKDTLRKRALKKRQAIPADEAQAAAESLADHIVSHIGNGKSIVAGYAATRGEIDLFPALLLLEGRGHRLCLPAIEHKEAPLSFRRFLASAKLIKGSYGIEIPETTDTYIPDVILVPLVAFDKQGNRLGYGAGYYDRTIAYLRKENPNLKTIGIAYASQQVAEVPAESYDEKLDAIITEKGVL